MDIHNKYILVIGGPTAVGKTAVSLKVAQYFGAEIISADSRQLYRKMDIGTAKPTPEELAVVPHHFIDILPPEVEYNAGQFERDALQLLDKLFSSHDTVVVAGGSGMYVQALCQGIDEMPAVPAEIRETLNMRLSAEGLPVLVQELEKLDPRYAQEVDQRNPQRVIRALEISLYTGKPYSDFRQQNFAKRPFGVIKIGLERPRSELYARIDQRMDAMIAEGLFEEARLLYPFRHLNALQTVGYKEIFDYLDGLYDQEEAVRLLKRNTRRYAKRQLTWFKKDPEFAWFHPDETEEIIAYCQRKMTMNS